MPIRGRRLAVSKSRRQSFLSGATLFTKHIFWIRVLYLPARSRPGYQKSPVALLLGHRGSSFTSQGQSIKKSPAVSIVIVETRISVVGHDARISVLLESIADCKNSLASGGRRRRGATY